jgi:hypothetical protein
MWDIVNVCSPASRLFYQLDGLVNSETLLRRAVAAAVILRYGIQWFGGLRGR